MNRLIPATLRPTVMEVSLQALRDNAQAIRARASTSRIMAVVKSNAYGHGLIESARTFVASGVDTLGVALVEEGIELRKSGITIPILVFGGIFGTQTQLYIEHDLDITASSCDKLMMIQQAAEALGKRARVHLKIDTGMERIGVHYYSADPLITLAQSCKNCEIVGIFSHFATADDQHNPLYKEQLARFLAVCDAFTQKTGLRPLRHIANSAALIRDPATHLDMVRPGIALYGVLPEPWLAQHISLKAAMRLTSRVVYFKVVRAGAGVSYNHTYTAPHDIRVVTIPIGYGDGFFRGLSNKGSVLIRGKRYPIIGNVCMDQMMVNIDRDEAFNGDEVVLLGTQGDQEISAHELAHHLNTIAYDVLTSTNLRVPRVYIP